MSPSIPWDMSLTITRVSAQEDIKNVFRTLLQANRLSASFDPNVVGTVSLRLSDVPIRSAFEQLIEQHNLTYDYEPVTNTVAIKGLSSGYSIAEEAIFVPLNQVEFAHVTEAMANFGLPLSSVKYDPPSRMVSITGDADGIRRVTELISALETASVRNQENADRAQARELEQRRTELAQRVYEDISRFEVRVIPLRFADVGPTTKQFQGRTVTIPGIEDTLISILGLNDPSIPPMPGAPGGGVAGMQLAEQRFFTQPRISIDPRTNSVVVRGTPEAIAQVEMILRELDRPLKMIEIEVLIVSADVGVAQQMGLNWRSSVINSGGTPNSLAFDTGTSGGRIGNGTGTDPFSTNGFDALSLLPTGVSSASTAASFILRSSAGVLQTQLQLLASQNRARILSAPRLVTLDNVTARITRSQNIYVQVDTRGETGSLGGVGLEQIQTGLTLEITPSIVPAESDLDETLIRLNLRAENSAPGGGVFGQIDVRSQEVQTNVLVPDGATYVIGGLFDDTYITSESGVPGLKDIPLLGKLFRNDSKSSTLSETIFFITPRVVDERTMLVDDIAVKIGSEEYIRRQRRALGQYHRDVGRNALLLPKSSLSALEEDE